MQWLDSSKLLEHMRDRLTDKSWISSEAFFEDKRLEMLSNIYVASLRCRYHAAPEYALLRAYVHTIYVLDTKCILRMQYAYDVCDMPAVASSCVRILLYMCPHTTI